MADNVYQVADDYRRDLLRGEAMAARQLVEAYGQLWQALKYELEGILAEYATSLALVQEPRWSVAFQRERLPILLRQIEQRMAQFASLADGTIQAGQGAALTQAQQDAQGLVQAALGTPPAGFVLSFAQVPHEAIERLIGFLQNGSPLKALLDELGPEAAAAVRKELVVGLGSGLNAQLIGDNIQRAMGMSLTRALTIARTEILRAYREATLASYQANSDVVKGWIWHSAANLRTCAMCWAMHGTFHRLNERLDDHPNGRCQMVPVTKSWAELGFPGVPETTVQPTMGPDLFGRLTEKQKRTVLGDAKYDAYSAGEITLQDLIARKRSREWGTTRYEASLKQVQGEAA